MSCGCACERGSTTWRIWNCEVLLELGPEQKSEKCGKRENQICIKRAYYFLKTTWILCGMHMIEQQGT